MLCLYTEKVQTTQHANDELNYIYVHIYIYLYLKKNVNMEVLNEKKRMEIYMPGATSIYAHSVHLQFYKVFPSVLLLRNISNT